MDLVTKASTTSSVHTDLQVSTLFESLSGYSVQKAWEINANEANKKKKLTEIEKKTQRNVQTIANGGKCEETFL